MKNRKLIAAVAIYLGLIAVCCIALYAIPSVRGMLERTYIAEYGRIDVNDEVSAFIVRDERVYVASQPSFIERQAETDKLVKAHTRVVKLTPDDAAIEAERAAAERTDELERQFSVAMGEDVEGVTEENDSDVKSETKNEKTDKSDKSDKSEGDKNKSGSSDKEDVKKSSDSKAADEEAAEADAGKYTELIEELGDSVRTTSKGYNKGAGYISYRIDGAEEKLSTDNLDNLTKSDLKKLTSRKSVELPTKKCGAGYPVFKVVRNAKWYLVYYLEKEKAERYVPGSTVTIDIQGRPVDVTVSQVLEGDDDSRVTLSCKTFFEGFLDKRTMDTTVNVVSAEGLVLETESIVDSPDGTHGVFVKNKLGEHIYKPVRIKADDGVHCVVYSDIYVDEEGSYVETIGTYDEIIASPDGEDMEALEKQVKERKKEEAAEKAAAQKAAKEEAKAEKSAAETAKDEAEKAKAEAEKKAKEAKEAAEEAEKKAKEAEEAARALEDKDTDDNTGSE